MSKNKIKKVRFMEVRTILYKPKRDKENGSKNKK